MGLSDGTLENSRAGVGDELIFWITELKCVKTTSETSEDDVYFIIEKSAVPEYHHRQDPLKMKKGFALPADIVLPIGSNVKEITISLREKDTALNSDGDDPIGSIYLTRDQFVSGSQTIHQTYGDAQAEYKVSWKVLPEGYQGPEKTFTFTKIKCIEDTTESKDDEIFFQTYKDSHGPTTYYKDNPLKMRDGDVKDIDFDEAIGAKDYTLRVDIRENDNSDVDKIGTVYLLCNEKSGSEKVYQTTGDAQAIYELTWTVA